MKLINYKYGHIPEFETCINGKIVMTKNEWKSARTYLLRASKSKRFMPSYRWVPQVLREDLKRTIKTQKGFILTIRVHLTECLVTKYNLSNYKRNNYMIEVLN